MDAIKIACDYISIVNLPATCQLVPSFRKHCLATNSGDDVLQLLNVLWFAYMWLSKQSWARSLPTTDNGAEDFLTVEMNAEDAPMVDISISRLSPSPGSSSLAPLQGAIRTKAQHKSEKYNDRRRANLTRGGGVVNPGHNISCPLCPRKSNRNGVINHLWGKLTIISASNFPSTLANPHTRLRLGLRT